MIEKVKLEKRDGNLYSYSIKIMGQERVLLTDAELLDLYQQINEIIIENEEFWEK